MVVTIMKDEKPQFLNCNLELSAANTFTQVAIPLPIQPSYGAKGAKARVIEILKVFVYAAPDTLAEDAAVVVQLTTRSETALIPNNNCERFIFLLGKDFQLVTSGAVSTEIPVVIDLSDGNGNGILVATQNIYLACYTVGQSGANKIGCKILYKFADVELAEYIGIVQSQQ